VDLDAFGATQLFPGDAFRGRTRPLFRRRLAGGELIPLIGLEGGKWVVTHFAIGSVLRALTKFYFGRIPAFIVYRFTENARTLRKNRLAVVRGIGR